MTIPNKKDNQTMIVDIRQFVPLDEAESYLLCLNQNTWLIVQMLHSFYGSWRNRYSQNVDIEEPLQPDDEEWREILDIFNQGEMELSQVTCLSDLIDKLSEINTTLAEKDMSPVVNVDCKGGGCGCSGGTGSVIDSPEAPGQPEGPGEGPGGFPPPEDWNPEVSGDYNDYKCKASNMIYDSISTTLNYIGGLYTAAGAIAAGAALGSWLLASVAAYSPIGVIGVSIFAVLTGWEVALIVGLVATASIIAGGSILYVFIEAKDELANRKEEFICALYNAGTVEAAREEAANILAECASAIDLTGTILEDYAETAINLVSEVLEYFLPNTLLNKLFTDDITVTEYGGGTVDCSTCEEAGFYTVTLGTETSEPEGNALPLIAELVYEEGHGCGAVARAFRAAFHQPVTITSIVLAGGQNGACTGILLYHYYSDEAETIALLHTNARPQDSAPVANVRSLYIVTSTDTSLTTVTVDYTTE